MPYDGFYPANRTVQLATLFSQSYGSNVSMERNRRRSPIAGGTRANAGFRPFLTPMFAPGIVYNTIKSGIAVDFPLLIGSDTVRSSHASTTVPGADFQSNNKIPILIIRVPFEAIIEPEAHHRKLRLLIDMEPHPSCSLNASASWNGNGDDRYKMAMHNFAAETPDFFLKNGTFTSFFSQSSKFLGL